MSLISRIARRLQRDFFRWRYLNAARDVLETRPVVRGTVQFTLLSMVHHRDIISYLVAVKSFTRFVNPERIVVVCDPSIDANDRAVLKKHVPHLEFREANEFTNSRIPRGGTWERLFAISHYVTEGYVVQLDADTVTLDSIDEVLASIQEGRGFVLGETPRQRLMSLAETSRRGPHPHVQAASELAIDSVGLPAENLYVRGCSGFTGFPRDERMAARMLDFSERMWDRLGDRWQEWGTEQVTSNYLVANTPGAAVLPFPKYGTPDQKNAKIVFLHFIGSMRFVNNKYTFTSREVIRALNLAA